MLRDVAAGFNEPEALAVIGKTSITQEGTPLIPDIGRNSSGDDHIFHLFVREKDSKAEIWDGARSGTHAALDVFNADETGDISNLTKLLAPLVDDASHVYTDITSPVTNNSTFLEFLRGPSKRPQGFSEMIGTKRVKALRPIMNDLRVTKTSAEIRNMRTAGRASGRAFTEAMRENFTREKHLDAFLGYRFKVNGCDRTAFEPVAAGGENALSIHYVRNDDVLKDGQLVLADAGGGYGGYVSDITRTWPVNGKFTAAQQDLYEAVLTVQRSCIKECREDTHTSLELLHQKAEKELKEELKQIGFDMSSNAINVLLPHHLSHYVGLDLHDCIGYSKKATLKTGQCITIEPGVYVPFDDRFPKHFQGMAIRIEDSVCVQEEGPLVLTTEAVKEVADIEALRQ
jgi:intermediate cleaving peptidase 55